MARPPPSTGGPPISFKTVPGRHRTQKWNVARQYDYSGDDWGGYDPYDDYGDEPQPAPGMQQGGPYSAGPGPQPGYGGLPSQQPGPGQRPRQQSFDEGEEKRAFSGPSAPGWGDPNRSGSPARSAVSGVSSGSGGRPSGDYARPGSGPGRMRDFTNPEQAPPPLNTRGSPVPMPGLPSSAPPGGYYPPRRDSASRGSPAPQVVPTLATTAPTTATEKELPTPPFIRPSDIYKRMEAEREKERTNSMDSNSRPSLDVSQEQDQNRDSSSSRQRPLSSVDESAAGDEEEGDRAGGANMSSNTGESQDFGEPIQTSTARQQSNGGTHALPPIQAVSGFGSSMFGSSRTTDPGQTPTSPPQTMQSAASSLQATPTATRAPPGSDPAADILAERTHDTPISAIGRRPDDLSHQASQASSSSQGFRSAVNRAFEEPTLSRDGSQYTKQSSDVSRSNTTSTSGISPIMSKAPWNEQMAPSVPTIAEEYQSRASSESSRNVIPRKPSPQQSRNASPRPSMDASRDVAAGTVETGYRRSLEPPSSDNSPAHTPGLETVEGSGKILGAGMAAQTMTATQADTEAEENDLAKKQLEERMGRPRAGTDYSIRESDLAHAVNRSPEKGDFDPQIAKAEKNEQDLFVQTHPQPCAPGTGFEAPASGRSSPGKGRVKEIADNYQDLHNRSRRGSTASDKSSWSNFRGSEENLPGKLAKRQGTNHSNMVSESDYGGVEEGGIRDSMVDDTQSPEELPSIDERPGLPSQQSFRPRLPGEWVSFSNTSRSGTPGGGLAPASAGNMQDDSRASWFPGDDGPVDLTPTTRKVPLESSDTPPSATMLGQAKDAGTALGAALMSSVGLGHQTRDFGSAQPAQEVEVPEDRRLAGETRGLTAPDRPQYSRGDTEASAITTVSNVSAVSRGSSRPPTPPAKDSPKPQSGYDRENNYFSAAIAPLRTGRSREASPEASPAPPASTLANYSSAYQGPGLERDDSLRREIVRSLDTSQRDDMARTQDARDAPENAARIAQGRDALPAQEISDDSPNKPLPLGLIGQRFSWETRPEQRGLLDTPRKEQDAPMLVEPETGREIGAIGGVPKVKEPEPESSPEIKPEMPYERPRSRGLHIMNASGDEDSDDERDRRSKTPDRGSGASLGVAAMGVAGAGALGSPGLVSPISKSQENLHLRAQPPETDGAEVERTSSLRDLAPSPISQGSGSLRLPSYYIQDSSALGFDAPQSPPLPQQESRDVDADAEAPEPVEAKPRPTFVDASIPGPPEKETTPVSSPTSPTSKGKIPTFKQILAIKNPEARVRGYDDTRRTFADMDTGLSNWLSDMLAHNPEYASLSTETYARPALQSTPSGIRGHKASPSLSKFTKQFGSSSDPQRSASVNAGGGGMGSDSKTAGGSVDMDKLQQRGKDLVKGAGVLGGKAQAGAKGLLAKGKSRFGTQRESKGKVPSPTTTFYKVPPATATDYDPYRASSPALSPSASRSPPPASSATPPSGSALAAPVSQTQTSSVYSISPPPILNPVQPPDRSRTQTPGSTSSGAISRTLSRLRERSRSLSSRSRSKSRPQSLVLLSSNHGSELQTVEDTSPRAARNGDVEAAAAAQSSRRGSAFGMAAVAPWSEPDEATSLGAAVDSVPVPMPFPDQLGVLPSPAVDSFSMHHGSSSKAVEGGAPDVPEIPTRDWSMGESVEDDAVPSQEDRGILEAGPAPTTPVADGVTREGKAEHEDELYDTTPRKAPAKDFEGGEDELYNITPRQLSSKDAERDEDAGETTPTARKLHDSVLLPVATDTPQAMNAEQAIAGSENKNEQPFETDAEQFDLPTPTDTTLGADAALTSREESVIDDDTPVISRQSTDLLDAPISRQSTDLLAVPAIAEPSGTQEWDKRSVISSNNDFDDAKEEASDDGKQSSRRSSVSSLGQDLDMDSQQPIMSSVAVPAGPSPEQSTLKPVDKFMNRPYQFGGAQDGRSKSYISLGQDSTGVPLQETLDIAGKPKHESVDLSTFSGPPPGAAPFQRQPAVRDVSGEHRPKRFSGMVKGRRPTLTSPDSPTAKAPPAAPAASAISDHYGLEGLQDDVENVIVGEIPPHPLPDKQEEKKAKRKSGLFDAFKRSGSVSKTEFSQESNTQRRDSRQNSNANLPAKVANQTRAAEPPKNIARTPQRAATTVKEPEQKKKRFSGLGSIFGRSSTTGHKSKEPKKLMKQHVPGREISQRQATEPGPNYEAREALKQQRRVEQQERQPNTYPPPSIGPPSQQLSLPDGNMLKSPEDMRPPPGGWYGPRTQQAEEQAIPQEDPPQYRSLDSDGRQDSSLRQIPEAVRPIDRSYSRPLRPIGHPPQAGMHSPPTSPVSPGAQARRTSYGAQGEFDQRSTFGHPANRVSSYGSNESGVSGQSEWERSQWRRQSSSPAVSPVQTRPDSDGFPPGRDFRVGSITEEMARSPAKEYNDQQTPWAITIPRLIENDPRRFGQVPSQGIQGGQGPRPAPLMQGGQGPPPPSLDYAPAGIGYAEEYPAPNRWRQQRGLPMSPESPGSSTPKQQFDPVMAHAPVLNERSPREMTRPQGNAYPSPPISPESQWFYNRSGLNPPSQMQYPPRPQGLDMPPGPHKRSYVQQRMFSYENDPLPPPPQPRRTSGYTGRRDDPTVGEESVEMRGVSYPGQEWSPERWE